MLYIGKSSSDASNLFMSSPAITKNTSNHTKVQANGIGTSIEHLKQEDESFDDQNYRIDLESAVIVLMDYTISLGMYNTTHQLYISFLEEIAANSGITVDGYYQISLRRITMDAVLDNPHRVTQQGLNLLQKAESQPPSDEIKSQIEITNSKCLLRHHAIS